MKRTKIKNTLNRARMIFSFFILLFIGYMIISKVHVDNISFLVAFIFFIYGANGLLTLMLIPTNDKVKKADFYIYVFNIILAFLFFYYSKLGVLLMPIVFGIYSIFNAFVKYIVYVLYQKEKVEGRFLILLECFLFGIIGVFMMFSPLVSIEDIILVIGIYCIAYSFTYFFDFLNDIFPPKKRNLYKRKFRLSPPMFLAIFIPYNALININKYFYNVDDTYNIEYDDDDSNTDLTPDLEVLIHVTEDGYGRAGHMDIFYNGNVISYGNYDSSSFRLCETVGDGVMFFTEKEKYIDFCIKTTKKTIFSFGLKLSTREKRMIDQKIEEIKNNTYRWHCPVEIDILNDVQQDIYEDYASNLYLSSETKFYKFKGGKFKTYFVLGTNCVFLCDTILGHIGTDIVKLSGIITPGAYYNYFNNEYKRYNSKVITKRIYNQYISIHS